MNDIIYASATRIAQAIRHKEISAEEVVQAHLDRIGQVNGALNAVVQLCADRAVSEAKAADEALARGDSVGPLHGVPMTLKDSLDTEGIISTGGTKGRESFVPSEDSVVAARLRAAGAILLGKTNPPEFTLAGETDNLIYGRTNNPYNRDRIPGGSSGGPAAAVASGEAFFSLGSDTGGSIRQPGSLCGIVGMKPTYGLVSRYGLIAFASSLDQIGPLTRDVRDSVIVLNAIAGHDPRDSTSIEFQPPDYTAALKTDLKGMRIGVPKEYFVDGMESGVEEATRKAIDVLKSLGAEIGEASLPHTSYALAVYYIIAPSECSANLARYDGVKYGFSEQDADSMWDAYEKTRQRGFGPEVKRRIMLGTYALSSGYYDAYYLKAQQVRTIIRQEFESEFEKFDALVMATSPSTAFKLGEKMDDPVQMYLNDVLTLPANIAGIPGISVPSGLSNGLPTGLQIMAKPLGEEAMFRIAYAYEQATDWHNMTPEL